jgi:hypothetical protein
MKESDEENQNEDEFKNTDLGSKKDGNDQNNKNKIINTWTNVNLDSRSSSHVNVMPTKDKKVLRN